ncbi:glycerate kinase [Thiohalocapsa marina]|uniref:glycerate kinase n=1 Tax=Thiohalocapsa marina TaxID=424902 RepID=UPI001FE2C839|nr:glycerate kinase [Thiohalocapsa marina]
MLAPNALKDSCTASVAADALAAGVRRALPSAEIVQLPVADGGDGLLEVLGVALGAELLRFRVAGPRRGQVEAPVAWLPARRTAIIETALASGLALLAGPERDPTATTTRGSGELMRRALDLGAERLVIGLGGSATNDGGIGMATALGYRFLDGAGEQVAPVGGNLARIRRIDVDGVDARVAGTRIDVVCDVDNPLLGPRGAARTYAPQKGARPEQVELLEQGLAHLAHLVRRDLGVDVRDLPGAGAAGGLGAGLIAFCGGRLCPGAELVLDLVDFDTHLCGADLVLTTEGRIDAQTGFGKAPGAVAARAARLGVPCIGIAGAVPWGEDGGLADPQAAGFQALVSLCHEPMTLERAQAQAQRLLERAAEQVLRIFIAGRRSAVQ